MGILKNMGFYYKFYEYKFWLENKYIPRDSIVLYSNMLSELGVSKGSNSKQQQAIASNRKQLH